MKKNILKYFVDILWLGSIAASIIMLITIIVFNLSVWNIVKIEFPVTTVTMNNYTYSFNTRYLEVRRINELVDEYIGGYLASDLYDKTNKKERADLYKIDYAKFERDMAMFPSARKIGMVYWGKSMVNRLLPLRYFTLAEHPDPILWISLLFFCISLFVIVILYNLRKLLRIIWEEGAFVSENSILIRYIGIYFILFEVVRNLILFFVNNFVAKHEWLNGVIRSYPFSFSNVNLLVVFFGIVFIILAEIIKQGAQIKQENDLTV